MIKNFMNAMQTSTGRTATLWLLLWTFNNMAVTLINKAAFAVVDFPYPYALTVIHMAICSLCTQYIFYSIATNPKSSSNMWIQMLGDELVQRQQLDVTNQRKIYAFSIIFSLNIAIGNVSLKYVSVNFNQIMRSLVPILTLWFSVYMLHKPISYARQKSVWPVVVGCALAYAGDRFYVTTTGVFYTLLCVVLASLKVVVSSELLTMGKKLHPVELLSYMAPLAMVQCFILSVLTGEAIEIVQRRNELLYNDWKPAFVLILSGLLAFLLNISALQAYKLTSPLTACIASAVKNVLLILLGTVLFQTKVTPLNGTGIFVVLVGSAYYSYISVIEQQQQRKKTESQSTTSNETINNDNDNGEVVDSTEDEELGRLETIPLKSEDTLVKKGEEISTVSRR